MKEIMQTILKQKRAKYVISVVSLIAFILILNFTYAAFYAKQTTTLANISVGKMNYNMKINSTETTKITALANKTTTAEIIITSLNKQATKYELIYEICVADNCQIKAIDNFEVQYSTFTIDPVACSNDGCQINPDESKVMRVVLINNTSENIILKFSVNAGFSHNTLALEKLITKEYQEADTLIAAYIDNEPSTTFPSTNKYNAMVTCNENGQPSQASGEVVWDGSKWVLNISGITTGNTICNVNFEEKQSIVTAPTGITATWENCPILNGYATGSTCTECTLEGYQYSKDQVEWSSIIPVSEKIRLIDYASNIQGVTSSDGTVYVRGIASDGTYSDVYEWRGLIKSSVC